MTFRNLARVGAVGLLAAGALAAAANPALAAADADLAVTAKGLTVSAGVPAKIGSVNVANKSDVAASGVTVVFDLSGLDLTKAVVVPPVSTDCTDERDGELIVCSVDDIAARSTFKDVLPVAVTGEAPGAAGSIKITVKHAGTDPNTADNTVEVPVTVAGGGVDLVVFANDVPTDEDGDVGTVAPGDTAPLTFVVLNQGTQVSRGLKLNIKLPAQTTFVGDYEDCTLNSAKNAIACDAPDLPIVPIADNPDQKPLEGTFEIAVSADAKAGVNLTNGVVAVATTGALPEEEAEDEAAVLRKAARALPSYLKFAAAPKDVDPSDDSDTFTVFVGQGAGGGEGGGGGLPVTGPAAFAIGGGGLAVLAAGLVLFFVARRRRIVLVTPGDEK